MGVERSNSIYPAIEAMFLSLWRELDFSKCNEQEVRELFISHLLRALGYFKGSTYDLELEKELKLSEPYHRIGRKKIAIDYAPSARLRYFWIIEAKPGTQVPMRYGDVLQAHLYAVHPEVQARFIVLCNGWEIRVYDAMTIRSFDDTLHICKQDDCHETFAQLRDILGAEHMLEFQRKRLIEIARDTLKVEVDLERFRKFRRNMLSLLNEGESIVQRNAQKMQSDYFFNSLKAEENEVRGISNAALFVYLDLPADPSPQSVDEFVRRMKQCTQAERGTLIDELIMYCMGRPHNIFRWQTLRILIQLLKEGVSIEPTRFVPNILTRIEDLARYNIEHWASSYISGPLVQLDNTASRVAYKICTKLAMEAIGALAHDLKKELPAERRVAEQPSVAQLMAASVGHAQEILWRKYCSGRTATDILDGVWTYQAIEKELDALPAIEYPDGSFDLLFFENNGLTHSKLRSGAQLSLQANLELLQLSGISHDILEFAHMDRKQMCQNTPKETNAPDDWKPSLTLLEITELILFPVVGLRAISVLAQLSNNRAI